MSVRSAPGWVMLLTSLAALSACGAATPDVDSVPDGPVLAAMVRGDGFIVPFAVYEGGVWRGPDDAPYPDLSDRATPWFEDRLTGLGRWRLSTPLGLADATGEPIAVSATGPPIEVDSHCQRVWGLSTDLAGTPTPEFTVHRTIGFAFSSGASPLQVAELDVTLDEMGKAVTFLAPYFNGAEAREVARRDATGDYGPRRVGADAATSSLGVTMLYRAGGTGGMSYYGFEAARVYGSVPDGSPDCLQATVMTGWLSESANGALALLSSDLSMTDCDRKGSPIIEPMAALTLDGQLFVLTIQRHYEGESYAIVRVNPGSATTTLTVFGGGC